MVMRPVGPHSARIYWRRRIVLVVVIALILIVALRACSGGSPTTPRTPATTSSTPAVTTYCTAKDLEISISPPTASVAVGAGQKFKARITSAAAASCQVLLPPSKEIWTIASDTATVWTDAGCEPASAGLQQVLAPGDHTSVTLAWDGNASATDCATGAPVPAGVYQITLKLGKVTSQPVSLTVTSS
jgi:hypothetical protein